VLEVCLEDKTEIGENCFLYEQGYEEYSGHDPDTFMTLSKIVLIFMDAYRKILKY